MKKFFLTTLLGLTVLAMQAQKATLKTTKEAHKLAETVMQQIVSGQSIQAFDTLKQYWPLDNLQIKNLGETTAEQIGMLEDQIGKLKGYEFVESETLGSFGYLEKFVIKYEQSALRLYIIFYNGGNGWMVNSVFWDDSWDVFFKSRLTSGN